VRGIHPAATPFWTGLATVADAGVAVALMDVFRQAGPLPCDGHARSLLLATVDRPALLDEGGDPSFLVDRLKKGLRDGLEPRLVASVAAAVVARGGGELADAGPLGGIGRGLGGDRVVGFRCVERRPMSG
jgi:hypothetical protein